MIITPKQDIEQYTRAGWWGRETLYDVFRIAAKAAPDAIALVDPPNRGDFTDGAPMRLTWRDVSDRVNRLCCALLDAGLCATVNSDDPAYFGGYMNQNFLEAFAALPQLTARHAHRLAANSFEASFAAADAKAGWYRALDKVFAAN